MQVQIIAVGKALPPELRPLAAEYEKRLKPILKLSWRLVTPVASSSPDSTRVQESAAILAALGGAKSVILLDERGQQQSNEDFAQTFQRLSGQQGVLAIVIGGAYGVDQAVRDRADFVWSFSELVFPHQLMRVMLIEQLYRTCMVLKGHPYHHK